MAFNGAPFIKKFLQRKGAKNAKLFICFSLHRNLCELCVFALKMVFWYEQQFRYFDYRKSQISLSPQPSACSAASTVCSMSVAMVMGPTPPGTGV